MARMQRLLVFQPSPTCPSPRLFQADLRTKRNSERETLQQRTSRLLRTADQQHPNQSYRYLPFLLRQLDVETSLERRVLDRRGCLIVYRIVQTCLSVAISEDSSPMSRIDVIRHEMLESPNNLAIGTHAIAETLGRPRATPENQETTGNRIPIEQTGENIMILTAEATKTHLAIPFGRPNANGTIDLTRDHAVPSQVMSVRRALVVTARRTLGVTVGVVETIQQTRHHKIKHQPRRFRRRSLL